ncbi:hypothetical protein AAG570_013076 [Ranatra chinensis]|uniref:cholesterol 7-desaturase n=1 Tax=Ranatra chinensis TaxID=642074 RepID=A0ABD0YY66_9HEMI
MIAESDSIKPGQVIHVIALGENLAVFRTNDGKCHALDAYCPHLGANMAIGGKVNNDCLQCPFHHWRFSGEDGKCVAVPYSQKVPKFAQVKKWLTCEVNDFIFLWYHAEGEEPNWYPEDIPQLKSKKYIYRGRNQFIVNCHVQEVSENGGDLSHFQAVHTASVLSGSDLRFFEKACLHFFRHNWSATWEPSSEPGRHHVGISKLSHQITLFGKLKLATCLVDVYQNGPGYVELYFKTSFGPMVLLQTVTPVEPLLQKIVHRIYCPPLLSLYASFALFAESIMIERDIMVWNHKKYIDKPLLVKEDKTLAKHRRWFSQFYSENSPLFSSRKENMDW